MHKTLISFVASLIILSFSCRKEKPKPVEEFGNISFNFTHNINGEAFNKDTMKYTNAAGNKYEVNELKYFISNVILTKTDGTQIKIDDWTSIYYVDIDIPTTLTWNVYDKIPVGNYQSISFTFGIPKEQNKSFMYVNPPEVNMFWPEVLGGGYHYMMLNGKWKDLSNIKRNYSFHLGIGQIYKNNVINVDSITGFVHNDFKTTFNNLSFSINKDQHKDIQIIMNIDSWFTTPHNYDHNVWGGDIMQKHDAMNLAKENGFDVFTLGYIR